MFPNEGQVIDIFFDAAPEATTYTLRRDSAAEGPWTTLPPSQAHLNTYNPARNPTCCEIMDMEAYKVGPGQTVWYVVDAWKDNNLIRSTWPIRMDLPSWFRGPLRVDMAKTGPDQWTIAWETFPEASSYGVLVRIDGTLINVSEQHQHPTRTDPAQPEWPDLWHSVLGLRLRRTHVE